jgi:hypothetical protein
VYRDLRTITESKRAREDRRLKVLIHASFNEARDAERLYTLFLVAAPVGRK